MYIVKKNVADLRSEPDFRSERLNQALLGDEVKLLEKNKEWTFVQLCDGYKGWVQSNQLLEIGHLKEFTHIVKGEIVNVYKEPNTNSERLTKVVFNTKLIVHKFQKNFACIELFSGYGWVDSNELIGMKEQCVLSQNNVGEMIRMAKKFIGVPYLWGGKTPFGFDCSGFVQTLFDYFLVKIPRDTNDQIKIGKEVEDLLQGDLVFFPRHVGICCEDNEFIHSSLSNGSVAVDNLSDKFIAARRVICMT
jgi:cell wall-associated NlpC family hydrolase